MEEHFWSFTIFILSKGINFKGKMEFLKLILSWFCKWTSNLGPIYLVIWDKGSSNLSKILSEYYGFAIFYFFSATFLMNCLLYFQLQYNV